MLLFRILITNNVSIMILFQEICEIELALVEFNLVCGQETLIINNKSYCGQLTGQTSK